MKQLLLVRHAKSSWADFSVADFDRPLNERGKRDAPVMAARLLEKKIPIDLFVSSPAKRARKTAEIFCKSYGRDKDLIHFIDELYLAEPPVFFEVISRLPDAHKSIALFSHNNGITDFANQLTSARIDELPTCGIFAIKADIRSWKDFRNAPKEFWFTDYPKATEE
ncbi:MAG: histidine phosphatase family protein [Chitinophagaceae bacterium]|nr:MAG: histidine phosphatase family protein [Chitinophagaceae bacterium]